MAPSTCSNFEEEEQRGIAIPDIKLNYKATVIKTVWYWHKSRTESMEQNREINPSLYGQIFNIGGRSIK